MVRLKHRYLLVDFLYPTVPKTPTNATSLPDVVQFNRPTSDKLTPQLLLRVIRDGVQELYGDYGSGVASASLKINYLSTATSTAIIRVTRSHYRLVWAAISFITHLPQPVGEACVLRVVRVSGTIRKAEEEAIRRARAAVLRAKLAAEGGQDRGYGPSGEEEIHKLVSIEDDESDEDEDEEED